MNIRVSAGMFRVWISLALFPGYANRDLIIETFADIKRNHRSKRYH